MLKTLTNDHIERLKQEKNIWVASIRSNFRPHLVPVWFVFEDGAIYICIAEQSVKGQNILNNSNVSLALEDGSNVLICEGSAAKIMMPWPKSIQKEFARKYDWDIVEDLEYDLLLGITPRKWLSW